MSQEEIITILCAAPCLAFWLGVFVGMMYSTFAYEDRESSRRHPRPGTEPFRPDSKLKPYKRSPDMLDKE